ncbi:MAG: acetyl-CoA hydrolase [Gordonia sp.]|nr:acetyl-CoA hydrolase [Gordonia sp. (in: high G+C Gram-positive bacteria)]
MLRIEPGEAVPFDVFVRPNDMVLWGQAAAEPMSLISSLMDQRSHLGGIRCFIGITRSTAVTEACTDHVDFFSFTGGHGAARSLAQSGNLQIFPIPYSAVPELVSSGPARADVVMLQLARTDDPDQFSISGAQDYLVAALRSARVVIGELNVAAPLTHGSREVSAEDIDVLVEVSRPATDVPSSQPSDVDVTIARLIADRIEDESTLQIGIGRIPDAVLARLSGHRDLGVHSGLIGDAVADLMESGVITNRRKGRDEGCSVSAFLSGGRRVLDFADRNPAIQLRPIEYVYDPVVLASIHRFVAINSALEVDLTGQVNAEVAAGSYLGTVGGAGDFLRAAKRSPGGTPIIALPSTVAAKSRIVTRLSGPVSTTRSDSGVIVTEFGVADLRAIPLRDRPAHMIAIAHPDHREQLAREVRDLPQFY